MQNTELMNLICENTLMQEIYTTENGPTIVGAWGKDVGTMEQRLRLALVYPDGEVSPIMEYSKSKLANINTIMGLVDLDGIQRKMIGKIHMNIMNKLDELAVQQDSSGKCSVRQAYQELCDYVEQYEEPGRVFIKDGYGNILASYLQTVLNKLELGYTRLELQKNFKAWGLLRTNQGTGHVYAYKINTGSANDWYFSFKLQEGSEAA